MSRWRLVWRRFKRNKSAIFGLVVIAALFIAAFLGPLVSKYSYDYIDANAFLKPPSPKHWFGTSQIGQDVFAQTMRGLQKSLIIGFLVGIISTGLAAIVGATACYFGGVIERFNLFVISLLLVLPDFLIIAIVSPRSRGQSWLWLVILISLFSWMLTSMVVYNLTLSLKQREFVTAARFMGVRPFTVITRHILPNMASFLIIDTTLTVGGAILLESGLSYFGFGVQPPDISLGTLIAAGTGSALTYVWLFAFAGSILTILVLAVSLVGDGLRDAIDPQSEARAAL